MRGIVLNYYTGLTFFIILMRSINPNFVGVFQVYFLGGQTDSLPWAVFLFLL